MILQRIIKTLNMTNLLATTTGKKSRYAAKKAAQKGGSYTGNSPFFTNIQEFQYLKPLHRDMYPHLRQWPGFRLPSAPRPNQYSLHNQPKPSEEEEYEGN